MLDEGFVPFPKRLLRCMHRLFTDGNAAKDLAVVLAIVDYARPNLTRKPSIEYLSFLAGLTIEEFEAGLVRLEQRGLIRVAREMDGGVDVSYAGLLVQIDQLTQGEA